MQRRNLVLGVAAISMSPAIWAQSSPQSLPKPLRNAKVVKPDVLPQKLVFGLITPRNAEQTLKNWTPLLERMGQAIGIPVQAKTYPAAADLVKDFVDGELQLAWLGNAAALEVVETGKASLFATMVVEGKSSYRSTLITHRDSPLRNLDDVLRQGSQLVFGDGDPKSTSGHVVPRYFAFAKKGVNDPEKLFKETRIGSHEKNLFATAKREVDFATNNTTELENFKNKQPLEAALIRVLWESPDIPESPMIWSNDLPVALKDKVAAFLIKFGATSEEEKAILVAINRVTSFRRTSNRQLLSIADLEMFNTRQRIMNDPKLTEEERQTRIDAASKRGSKLELMLKG
jgi:phosphonate transport system substrate-binding protein